MKRLSIYVIAIFIGQLLFSQEQENIQKVEVPYTKLVTLMFDAEIEDYVLASNSFHVDQKGKRLTIKSKLEDFTETDMFVQLKNGWSYAFILTYNNSPSKIFHHYSDTDAIYIPGKSEEQKQIENDSIIEVNTMESNAATVRAINNDHTEYGVIGKKTKITLDGIYYDDDKLFFSINIQNNSAIDYDIDLIRFVIKGNSGVMKKAAIQEEEKKPIFVLGGDDKRIESKSTLQRVYVLDKFTISKDKKLFVEIWEANGDRKVEFYVPFKEILNAKQIK